MNFLIRCCLVLGVLGLFHSAQGQKKNKPITEKEEKAEELPPMEVLDSASLFPPATIDFDTTAIPQDRFTDSVKKLLLIIGSKQKDLEMGERALRQSMAFYLENPETRSLGEKFIAKFLAEMTDGRAAQWMENVYIRNYRAIFTLDEMHSMINFYQTPAGQKSLQKSMLLLENVMSEAKKIGTYLGQEIMASIEAEEKTNN